MVDPEEMVVAKAEDKIFVESTEDLYEITDLPSKFLLYPKGTKIYGRPFTVKEVKRLSTMNENNHHIIMKEVLSSAIRGIKIDDLYLADKMYIIFWLRANTYKDANFTTPYICSHCERESEYVFDVGEFEIKYLEDSAATGMSFTLPKGDEIILDFLKISDEDRIKRFKDSLRGGLAKYDDEDIAIAAMIKSINGETGSLRSYCDYLNALNPTDWSYLVSYAQEHEFGAIPVINATCKHTDCREVEEVPVSFRSDFFVPRYNFR